MKLNNYQSMIPSPEIKTQFLAELEFGMPSKKCQNFGICNINPIRWENLADYEQKGDTLAIVTLFLSNYVEVDFLRSSLSPETYQKFLAKGEFLIQEDYHFNQSTEKDFHFTVKKGSYRIYENSSLIKVVLRLPTMLEQELLELVSSKNEDSR